MSVCVCVCVCVLNKISYDYFLFIMKKSYGYYGCMAHGHPPGQCPITAKIKDNEWFKKQPAALERTLRKKQFLRDRGVLVTSIWECQFQKEKKRKS